MKAFFSTLSMLSILGCVTTANAQNDSLQNYTKQAQANNPNILSMQKGFLADSAAATGTGTLPEPSLSASYLAGLMANSPKAMQIGISQSFPWAGTRKAEKNAAIQKANEKQEQYVNTQNKVSTEVYLAWLQYYRIKKDTELIRQSTNNLNMLLKISLTEFKAGSLSMADVLKVKLQLLETENRLKDMQSDRNVVRSKLNELLNTQNKEFVIPDTLPAEDLPLPQVALYDSIAANNPVLKQYTYSQAEWSDNALLAKKQGLPEISISMGYQNVFSSPYLRTTDGGTMPMMMNMLMSGVGISLPIYRKKYKAMEQQASLMSQSAGFMKADKLNDYRQQLQQNYSAYSNAQRHVQLNIQELALASQALNLIITDYSSGKGSIDDIITMENKKLDYAMQLTEAVVEQNSTVAKINLLMGK